MKRGVVLVVLFVLSGCLDFFSDSILDTEAGKKLHGYWKDAEGLVLLFDDDKALVEAFGASEFGDFENFNVGDEFMKTIVETGANQYTAYIRYIDEEKGVVFGDTATALSIDGDNLSYTDVTGRTRQFSYVGAEYNGTPKFGDLTSSSPCSEWWPVLVGVGKWRVVENTDNAFIDGRDDMYVFQEWWFQFSGENKARSYSVRHPVVEGDDPFVSDLNGTVKFEDFLGQCRMMSYDGGPGFFTKAYSYGELYFGAKDDSRYTKLVPF
jgi:hypothetical protein